jgi:type IV pilus assembly protein PilM
MNIDNMLSFFKEKLNIILKVNVDSVIVLSVETAKLTLLNIDLKGKISVDALKEVEFEAGNKDSVILSSLRSFLQENSILSKHVILRPFLNSLIIKRIQLPIVPDKELLEAIKWQLKDDISFDLSEAVLDFSIIRKTTKEDGYRVFDIICAIAHEKEVNSYVLLIKQLGLSCLSVGVLPFGYEKLVERYLKQQNDDPLGILHLSQDTCCLNIFKNNKLVFYRELPISVTQLRDSLRGALVSHSGRVELSLEEADDVLFTVGVPDKDSVYKDKINSSQILSMLRPMLERLAGEIKRSLAYYESYFQGSPVNKIFISGRGVGIQNIDNFLGKELSFDIAKLSIKDMIALPANVEPQAIVQNLYSLGLALDFKNNVNILPFEYRSEKSEKLQKFSLRWIAFAAFLLFFVSFIFVHAGVKLYQSQLDNAKVHMNVLSEVLTIKEKNEQLNSFVKEIRDSEFPVGRMLKKISSVTPKDLFFVDLSLDCDSNKGSIKGYIKNSDKNPNVTLAKFIADMKNSAYFSEAAISKVAQNDSGGVVVTEFDISFKLF